MAEDRGCRPITSVTIRTALPLEADLDSTIYNSAFSGCINLAERRHLVRWENDLAEASLPSVGDVFGVDKETVLAERLFAKDSQHPIGFGLETD